MFHASPSCFLTARAVSINWQRNIRSSRRVSRGVSLAVAAADARCDDPGQSARRVRRSGDERHGLRRGGQAAADNKRHWWTRDADCSALPWQRRQGI